MRKAKNLGDKGKEVVIGENLEDQSPGNRIEAFYKMTQNYRSEIDKSFKNHTNTSDKIISNLNLLSKLS